MEKTNDLIEIKVLGSVLISKSMVEKGLILMPNEFHLTIYEHTENHEQFVKFVDLEYPIGVDLPTIVKKSNVDINDQFTGDPYEDLEEGD